MTKSFIEDGSTDVEGFKALEKSFSHQHRGQQVHSHFMRPLCQSTPRATRVDESEAEQSQFDPDPPIIVINGGPEATQAAAPKTPIKSSTTTEEKTEQAKSSQKSGGENAKGTPKGKRSNIKGNKSPRGGTATPTKNVRRQSSYPLDSRHHPRSPGSPGRRDATAPAKANIFTFMPYLHFETNKRRQEMQEAIKRAEKVQSPFRPYLTKAATYDEMLIRAHLTTSTVSLHVRRTLDQSFYHNIDTESRDQDQVVYRYQTKGRDADDPTFDPKVVMVDQLWMWILGKDLIVTSFPQRWQQPKNDPLNILDNIIEDINSKTREPVRCVYDLAMVITNRCSGVFAHHRMGDEEYQFLDMFESSIGSVTDREAVLFKEFSAASAQASAWLQHHRRPNRFSKILNRAKEDNASQKEEQLKYEDFMRGPLFVDKLLDIGHETDLLAETKDIRDELNMIAKVLEDQRQVLPDLEAAVCDIYRDEQRSQYDIKKRFKEQLKAIEMHIKDIDRMDKQAERIYSSITDMLDLKQKHANAFEARFARDQAAGTARQSQTIMVFTIVTIVFLPLSFIAAFFTINIKEFPRAKDGSAALPLGYVSKYMFGIGFAISIPLVVIALLLDDFGGLLREVKRRFALRKSKKTTEEVEYVDFEGGLDALKMEQMLSIARSRKSADVEWASGLPRISMETARTREKATGFRMRMSGEGESG
jgi:Mg2+ and Co2+ transporter CorA